METARTIPETKEMVNSQEVESLAPVALAGQSDLRDGGSFTVSHDLDPVYTKTRLEVYRFGSKRDRLPGNLVKWGIGENGKLWNWESGVTMESVVL